MSSEPSSVSPGGEVRPPLEVHAPCAGIGAELRCVFGDPLAAAPLPGRLADLFAALEATCSAKPAGGGRGL